MFCAMFSVQFSVSKSKNVDNEIATLAAILLHLENFLLVFEAARKN